MHDEFNCENVSDMAGSGYEREGIRGEGSFDEGLKQNGHRDGGQNHLGGSVEKVGVAPDPKRVGPASRNLEYG